MTEPCRAAPPALARTNRLVGPPDRPATGRAPRVAHLAWFTASERA